MMGFRRDETVIQPDFEERSDLMQTAVTVKKPGNTAFSGHFRAGGTYRGRIKDDHKIDTACGSSGFPVHTIFHVWRQMAKDRGLDISEFFSLDQKSATYCRFIYLMVVFDTSSRCAHSPEVA